MTFEPVSWPASDLLAQAAERTPEKIALIDTATGERWSFESLSGGLVAEVAAGLRTAGLGPGDHLGALAEPGLDAAVVQYAAARAGLVFVPLPPDAPAATLERRGESADLDALVASRNRLDAARTTSREAIPLDELPAMPDGKPGHRWKRDEVRWLISTSGTTGEPKPVRLTAGNLAASAMASAGRLGVEPDDRWLACLPMHHVGGLAPLVRSARYGTTAVVQPDFDARTTAAVMAAHDVTGVSLVPTMLTRLLDAGWTPSASLRFVLLGGAPTIDDLIERCEDAGIPLYPTYGATETASQIATALPDEAFAHPGTVGRPLDGLDVAVVDGSGEPLPNGEVGELVVSGPVVSPGYHGDHEATAARFPGGRFRTRDRGYRDAAGRLWVLGRLDAAIHTGGETVHPEPIERALRAHPAVESAAVVGLDDPEWGEAVAALVVPLDRGRLNEAALLEHCRERLDPPSVPKRLVVAEGLPLTASGTVDREAVRDRLAEADPGGL